MIIDQKGNTLSVLQSRRILDITEDVIDKLPPQVVSDLLSGGYENDIDNMINNIASQVNYAIDFGRSLDTERLDYIDNLSAAMDERLRILSWNYFNATVLTNFSMGWRNLEWGNLTQLFPWSSYLCSRGSGKCLSINELVVMYDGSLKKVQDIKVGDQVMGIDNTPRTVLQLHRGKAPMYKVHQTYAKDYCVNEGHLVCCIWDRQTTVNNKRVVKRICKEIPVEEIPNHKGYNQKKIFGYKKEGGWELPEKDLIIDPYWLGLWLGDGMSQNQYITNPDIEVREAIKKYADIIGGQYYYNETYLLNGISGVNLLSKLKELGLLKNKHIPDIYMRSSKQQRFQLLAGILDSDGYLNQLYYSKKKGRIKNACTFELSLTNYKLIEQVRYLALSLGFRCISIEKHTRKKIKVNSVKYKKEYEYKDYEFYRIYISGEIWIIPTKIQRKQAISYTKVQQGNKSALTVTFDKIDDYYGFALDGDHKFLLEDGTVVHNSYQWGYTFCLWRLYSYTRPYLYTGDTVDNKNRKETALITNTMTLAKNHVSKIIEEIELNPILSQKLNPNNKAKLGETMIETETGSKLHVRGKDGFIRGLHVGAALVDDLPDESSIYSDEQRDKLKELFRGTITPIVEPYGYLIVSGTPYSTASNELYNVIKNDKRFAVFEYPIIFPNDGRPLAPDRFTFTDILQKKEELGTMVFSREYLVVPIADDSTIFPMEYLMRSTIGMENISFADSIDFFPFKLSKVVIGCDFAISGNIGADYTVYTVWGIDSMNNYYLLNIFRQKGMSHNEQIDKIVHLDRLFRPNKIVCENNGFQGILSALAKERGLKNIEQFTTTEGNKKDLHTGWPSLSAMFERGQIKIPYKIGNTKEMVTIIFGEFSSITFRSDKGKLEAVGAHDDIVSSSFMAINSLREETPNKFSIELI